MKHVSLLIGAAALSFSAPTLAKPGGGGGGPRVGGMGMGAAHANPHSTGMRGPQTDRSNSGIGLHGRPSSRVGYGAGGCPPGLAKKSTPCVPPGLAKQQFSVGERIPSNLGLLSLGALPRSVRTRAGTHLSRHSRFLRTDDALVAVNPRTRTVERVIRIH